MSNNGFHFKKNTARKSMPINPAYYEGHHSTVILGDEQRFNNFNYSNGQSFYYDNNFSTMNGQVLNEYVPSSVFPAKKPLLGDRPGSLGPKFRSYSLDGMVNNFGPNTEFCDNSAVPGYRKNNFRSESPDDLPKLFKSPRKRAFQNRHYFSNKKSCVQERVFERGIKRQLSQGSATSGSDSNDNFNEIFGPDGIDRFDQQQNGPKTANKNEPKQQHFKRARWDNSCEKDKKSSSRNREDFHRKGDSRKKERRSSYNGSRRFHDRFDSVRRDHHRSSRSPSSENSSNSSNDISKKNREKRTPDRGRMSEEEAKDKEQFRKKSSFSESHKNDSRRRPSERDHNRHKDMPGKSRKKDGQHINNKRIASENDNPKGKVSVEDEKSKNISGSDDKSNTKNRTDKFDDSTNKINSVLKSVALNTGRCESVTLNSDKCNSVTLNSDKCESVTLNSNKPTSSEKNSTKISNENMISKNKSDDSNRKTDGNYQKQKSLENGKISSDFNKSPSLPKPEFLENSGTKQEQKSRNLFDLSFLSDKLKSPELKSLKRDIHRSSSEDKISENSVAKVTSSTISKELKKNSESKEKDNECNDAITADKESESMHKITSFNEDMSKGNTATKMEIMEGKVLDKTSSNSDKQAMKDISSSDSMSAVESKSKSVKTSMEEKTKVSSSKLTSDLSSKLTSDLSSKLALDSSSQLSSDSSSKSTTLSSSKPTISSSKSTTVSSLKSTSDFSSNLTSDSSTKSTSDSLSKLTSDSSTKSTSDSSTKSTSDSSSKLTSDSSSKLTSDSSSKTASDSSTKSTSDSSSKLTSASSSKLTSASSSKSTSKLTSASSSKLTSNSSSKSESDSSTKSTSDSSSKLVSDSLTKLTTVSSSKSTSDSVKSSSSDTVELNSLKKVSDLSKSVKESAKTILSAKSQRSENKSRSASVSECRKSGESKNSSDSVKKEISSNLSKSEKKSSSSLSTSSSSKICSKTKNTFSSKTERDSSKSTSVSSVQNLDTGSKTSNSKSSDVCDKLSISSTSKSENLTTKITSNKESKDLSKCEKRSPKSSKMSDLTKPRTMSSKHSSTNNSQESGKLSSTAELENSSSVSEKVLYKTQKREKEKNSGISKTEKTSSKVLNSSDVSKSVKKVSNSVRQHETQKLSGNSKEQKKLKKSPSSGSECEKVLNITLNNSKFSTDVSRSGSENLKASVSKSESLPEAKLSEKSGDKFVSKLSPGDKKLKKKKHLSSMKSLQSSSLKSLKTSQKSSQFSSVASKLKYSSNKNRLKCEKRRSKSMSGVSISKDFHTEGSVKSKGDTSIIQCISKITKDTEETRKSEVSQEKTRKRHKSEEQQTENEKKRPRHKSEKIMSNFDIMSQNFSASGKTLKLPLLFGNTRSSRPDGIPDLSRSSHSGDGELNNELNHDDAQLTTTSPVPVSVITYGKSVESPSYTKGSKHSELSSEGVMTSIMNSEKYISGSDNSETSHLDKNGIERKNGFYQPGTSDISSEDDGTNTDDDRESDFDKKEKMKDGEFTEKQMNKKLIGQVGEKMKKMDNKGSKECIESSEETCCESGGSTPLQDELSDYEMNECLFTNKKSHGGLRLNVLVKKEPIDDDLLNIKKEPLDMEYDVNHKIKNEKDDNSQNSNACNDHTNINSDSINKDDVPDTNVRSRENNTPEIISSAEDSTSDTQENNDNDDINEKVNSNNSNEERDNSGNLVIDFGNNSNSHMIKTSEAEVCNHDENNENQNSDLEGNSDVLKNSRRPQTPNFSNLDEILGLDQKVCEGNMSVENPVNDNESNILQETPRIVTEKADIGKQNGNSVSRNGKDCNVNDCHLSEDLVSENSMMESEGRENNSLDETIAYCQSSEGDETIEESASLANNNVAGDCNDNVDKNQGHINDTVPNSTNNTEAVKNAMKNSDEIETMAAKDMNRVESELHGDNNRNEIMVSQGETSGQSSKGNSDRNTNEKVEKMDLNMSASLLDTDTEEVIQDASFNSDDLLQDEIDDNDIRVMVYVKGVPQSPWTPAPAKHELSDEEDEFNELLTEKNMLSSLTCKSKNDTSSNLIPSSLPCSPELEDTNFESLSGGGTDSLSRRSISLSGKDSSTSNSVSDLKSTEMSENSQNEEKDDRSTESTQSNSKTFYATTLESSSVSLEEQINNLDVMLKSLSESLAESNSPMNRVMIDSLSTFSKKFSGLKSTHDNNTEDIALSKGNTKTGELNNAVVSNSENGSRLPCGIQNTQSTEGRNSSPQVTDLVRKPQVKTVNDKCISLASGNVEELHIETASRNINLTNTDSQNNIGDKLSNCVSVPRLSTIPTVSDSATGYNDVTRNRHKSGSSNLQHPNFSSLNIQHPNFTNANAQQPNFLSSNSQHQQFSSSNAQQIEHFNANKTMGNISQFSELSSNPAGRHQRSRTLPETYVSPEMQHQYQQAALKLNALSDSGKNTGYLTQVNTNTNTIQMNPPPLYASTQQNQSSSGTSEFYCKNLNRWTGNDVSNDFNNFSRQTTPADMNIRFTHIKTVIAQGMIRTINSVGIVLPVLYSDDLRRCVQCYNCKNFFSPLQFKMHLDGKMKNMVHLESLNAEFIPTRKLNQLEIAEWDKFLQIFNAEVKKRSMGANQNQQPRHSQQNTQTQYSANQIPGSTAPPASRNVRRHTVGQSINPSTTQQSMYHYTANQVPPPSLVPKGPMDVMTIDQQNRQTNIPPDNRQHQTNIPPDSRQSCYTLNPQSSQNRNTHNIPHNMVDSPSYQSSVSRHANYGMPDITQMQTTLSTNQTLQKSTSPSFTESQSIVQSISPAQKQTNRLSVSVPEASQSSGQPRKTPPTQMTEDSSHNSKLNTTSFVSSKVTLDIPNDNSNDRLSQVNASPEPNQRTSPGTSGSDTSSHNNIFRTDSSGSIQLNVQTPSDIIRTFRMAQNIQMECLSSMAAYMGQLEETVNRLEKGLHLANLKNKESEDNLEKFGKKIKDLFKQLNGSDNDT